VSETVPLGARTETKIYRNGEIEVHYAVGGVVSFCTRKLASNEASWVTGSELVIRGGMTAN
jgi:hypothetical protein